MTTTPQAAVLPRHAVLADTLPGARVRDTILVFGGALLTALLAQIAIMVPPSPIPVTGQTLAVVLAGATLGAQRGALALMLYLMLGLFLPFYAGGSSGWHVIWGSGGGYLIGSSLPPPRSGGFQSTAPTAKSLARSLPSSSDSSSSLRSASPA
jgi:biotin transport system substrate-specific component